MIKITALFMLIAFSVSFAQNENISLEILSIDEGLSQVTVNSIIQDYMGFMWFATDDGLNKYDGYGFKVYNYNPSDPESFQSNEIKILYEDSINRMWAGTDGGGLYYYQRGKDKFIRTGNDRLISKRLSSQSIVAIHEYFGFLWIGTPNGLNRLDLTTGEIKKYFHDDSDINSIPDNFITSICGDDESNLWIGTKNGLSKLNLISEKLTNYKHSSRSNSISGNSIYSITSSKADIIWIATETKGVSAYNPFTDSFARYSHSPGGKNKLSGNNTFCIYEDKKGNIWASTINGLNIYDEEENMFKKIISQYNEKSRGGFARVIYEDQENNIWTGTDNAGVVKLKISKSKFKNYLATDIKSEMLSVVPIFEDSENILWVGTFGYGIFNIDPANNKIDKFKHNDIIGNYLISINEDQDKNIWIGTRNKGIFVYNKKSDSIENYTKSNSGLTADFISVIYNDKENNIWIGTYGGGVLNFNRDAKTFNSFDTDNAQLYNKNIASIIEDNNGNIWIGTEGIGVFKYNADSGNIINYKKEPSSNSLSHNEVNSIIQDKNGILWIGTYTGGLNKYDPETNTFDYYSTEDGLINNSVYGVLEDRKGNIWLSTNRGLSKFNPIKKTFVNYYQFDEIKSKEFNQGAYFKSRSGKLYFGGTNGLVAFDPDSIKKESADYKIVLTDFRIANKSVHINEKSQLRKHISIADEIYLSYRDYVFEFEFAALNYSLQNKIKYAYKMNNFDEEWIITDTKKRYASYTNLEPGNYTFIVRVIDESGELSTESASIKIFISPPFWNTWWFYMLIVFAAASILYSLYRYKINKLLELERLRVGIASDLHDDIGATLTKLAFKADMIKQDLDSEDMSSGLNRISEMSRHAVSAMSDIVWSIDSRNDTFESMINKMKDFSFGVLADKEIKVEFSAEGFNLDDKAPIELRQNLYLIMKEAVNNIAKHSNADIVKISLLSKNEEYLLTIFDNGSNYKEKDFNVGHGLRNMKMRAEKINADIEYNNQNGFGITIKGKI